MLTLPSSWRRKRWILISLLCASSIAAQVPTADKSTAPSTRSLFSEAPFARWIVEGPVVQVPWKVKTFSHGLSLHQRLVEHIEVEMHGRELAKRAGHGRMVLLVQVTDAQGHEFRDHGLLDLIEVKPEIHKKTVAWSWDAFALPGEYRVTLALYDTATGEHDLGQSTIKVEPVKNDPLPDLWSGLPSWEFWAPLDDTDLLFHPDIEGHLHLAPVSKRPVRLEVMADLTPSDLFHGSTRFYTHYLAVVVPLMKALSQIQLAGGDVDVSTVDLRRHKVTFEQESGNDKDLDWGRIKQVVSPENGPATIDAQVLQQKHERPDFLREELLRRLNIPAGTVANQAKPLRVFVVIGSPMDFYSFHSMPPIEGAPGEEDCLVYYLQYELYNPTYASGALGNVRKLLKPLPVHTMKVRSPQSIRDALARMMEDIGRH